MELTLDLDEDVHERLRERAAATGFESPEAYATAALRTILEEVDTGRDETPESRDDDAVESRLEDLGYL